MPVVTALYIYPVKGCRGVRVESAEVARRGFSRDRRYMIVDADGRFVTQREMPRLALVKAALDETDKSIRLEAPGLGAVDVPLEHETGPRRAIQVWDHHGEAVPHREGSAWICRLLGPNHALVYMPESEIRPVNPDRARPGEILSFADAYPVLLISEASLADLNGRLADPVTMDRFRPSSAIVANCSSAASRSSAMSAAMISGAGRLALSSSALVLQPEDVEVDLVALDELVVGEGLEALALLALVAVLRVVAGDEVVEVGALERVLLQREVLVGAQVVDPELLRSTAFPARACGRRRGRSP